MQPKQQRYKFGKADKLKSRKSIEHLFAKGKSFSNFPFKVIWEHGNKNKQTIQVGFAVSSRNFKKAVDRNRIKRLMREAYRLQQNKLQEYLGAKQKKLAVFVIYVGNELPDYSQIFERTGAALARLQKIINEDTVADT